MRTKVLIPCKYEKLIDSMTVSEDESHKYAQKYLLIGPNRSKKKQNVYWKFMGNFKR